MKLFKWSVMLLALLLAAMALVPMASAADHGKDVDQVTAQHIAEMHVQTVAKMPGNYTEWEGGTVQPSTVYFDLNDRKAAYLFNVYVNGLYSGYVLISATRDNYPVLEFSRGKVPDADPEKFSHSRQAVLSSINVKTENVGSPKLLYLGGTFYFAQYPVTDSKGNTVDKKTVDLSDNSVVDLQDLEKKYPLNAEEQKSRESAKVKDANMMWESLENNNSNPVSVSTASVSRAYGSKYIPGVPLYSQPLNNYCSPTSAGMVLSYWDSHGYPNIPDNSYTLITELASAMGTSTSTGTYIYNVNDGMNTVCSNHGYGSLTFAEDTWVTFSDVTTEVNANKPFVLNMLGGGTAYGRSQAYGDHSVAVIGYESYSSGDYVVVQDTWTPLTAVSLSFGNWWGAVADYSRP